MAVIVGITSLDLQCDVYYKSLFGTGRDGRDGTNGAKVGNIFLFYYSFISISERKTICHESKTTIRRILIARLMCLHFAFKQRQFLTMVIK